MKMERAIVVCAVNILWSIRQANQSLMHLWHADDAVLRCPYATLLVSQCE